jgi:hypothetical protein
MRNEETVKLISADGFGFVIDSAAAMVSKMLCNMLIFRVVEPDLRNSFGSEFNSI